MAEWWIATYVVVLLAAGVSLATIFLAGIKRSAVEFAALVLTLGPGISALVLL